MQSEWLRSMRRIGVYLLLAALLPPHVVLLLLLLLEAVTDVVFHQLLLSRDRHRSDVLGGETIVEESLYTEAIREGAGQLAEALHRIRGLDVLTVG